LINSRLEGGKLGCEVGFHGVKFVFYFFNAGIGRANLKCHMFDEGMGLIDGSLDFLVTSGVHLERGSVRKGKWVGGTTKNNLLVIGTTTIIARREIKWNRWNNRENR
jgi:hypothetical protein